MKKIIVIVRGIIVWVTCVVLDLQFSFGIVGFFDFILIILLGAIIVSVVGLLKFILKKQYKFLGIGLILLIFCVLEIKVSGYIAEQQKQQSFVQAKQIISALEHFRSTKGDYPADIIDLVPGYFKKLPTTKMGWLGTPFNYYKMKDGSYRLSFAFRVFLIANYDPKRGEWIVDD